MHLLVVQYTISKKVISIKAETYLLPSRYTCTFTKMVVYLDNYFNQKDICVTFAINNTSTSPFWCNELQWTFVQAALVLFYTSFCNFTKIKKQNRQHEAWQWSHFIAISFCSCENIKQAFRYLTTCNEVNPLYMVNKHL